MDRVRRGAVRLFSRKDAMRDLGDVTLPPEEFEALALLCRRDRDFPPTVAAWRALIAGATLEAHHRGNYPAPLVLDVDTFAAWCKRMQVLPCLDTLRAFAVLKRREVTDLDDIGQ